jgi:hypothetical protein
MKVIASIAKIGIGDIYKIVMCELFLIKTAHSVGNFYCLLFLLLRPFLES